MRPAPWHPKNYWHVSDEWVAVGRNDMLDGEAGLALIKAFEASRADPMALELWRRVHVRYGQWFYCPHWEAAVC